jgi:cysteine synthase
LEPVDHIVIYGSTLVKIVWYQLLKSLEQQQDSTSVTLAHFCVLAWHCSGGEPGKHEIQGLGPGFLPEILDTSVIDEVVTVNTGDAMANARRLAMEEGLLVGISSGANLAACLKVHI